MKSYKKLRLKAFVLKNIPRFIQLKINELLYYRAIGRKLNWDSPQSYTEKIQWSKFNDNSEFKTILSDKFLVRDWVKSKIGEEYLIPLLGVWDEFSEINFDKLPSQFVLKTNHGSGSVVIVKDKSALDLKETQKKFDSWMKTDFAYTTGFELHYSAIKRKIIAEKYLETELGELQDYKFLCFNGTPYYCWVDVGRFNKHTRNVYDLEWNLQEWNQHLYGNYQGNLPKPDNFDQMIKIAKILCKGFRHVRVDLYSVNNNIYFGEMTFTNGCGFDKIVPDKYDFILGDLWNIES